MSPLSIIHESKPGAAACTAATAADARALGFTDVQTHYEPQTGNHVVTGTPPAVPDSPNRR